MVQAGLMSTFRTKHKSGIDVFYLVINCIDVDLDIKYLSRDVYYPKSTK